LIQKALLIFIIILSVLPGCGRGGENALKEALSSSGSRYAILVDKRDFSLKVYGRDLRVAAAYRIGYGSNGDMKAKLYEGDNRTPEGVYSVNEILSMDAGHETDSYRKIMAMNRIYFRSSAGYRRYGNPGEDLGENAYGPRYFGIDYPNENDRERYGRALAEGKIPSMKGRTAGIGYGIAVHGNNDEESIGHLCSSGCIRMYNRDIVELKSMLKSVLL